MLIINNNTKHNNAAAAAQHAAAPDVTATAKPNPTKTGALTAPEIATTKAESEAVRAASDNAAIKITETTSTSQDSEIEDQSYLTAMESLLLYTTW